jgi:peroxiredoxin
VAQKMDGSRRAARKKEKDSRRTARSVALAVTAVIVVGGAAVGIYLATRTATSLEGASLATKPSGGGAGAAPAVAPSSPEALEAAANAVGFHQTTAASVGIVENLPANTPLLTPTRTLLPVGVQAPDFTLSTPEGATVRLSDYRGKAVFLEFFATWCPHCQAEAQHLLRVYQGLSTKEFAFLSVNANSEDAASIHAFTRFFKTPWPALLDPGTPLGNFNQAGGPGPVTQAYGIGLYPTFFIIDRAGKIVWRADREQPDALILQKLQNAAGF